MLTSADETDLLIPLFGGGEGDARFTPFLERLMRRTRADHAALVLDDREFSAGRAAAGLARLVRAARLRPGRVYALAELADGDGFDGGDARVLRLGGSAGAAWLVIARGGECSAADAALLSALAPYVGIALGQYRAAHHRAAQGRAASAALARAGAGWILFDADGRVVEADPALAARGDAIGLRLRPGERVAGVAAALAELDTADSCALVLHADPRVEAVIVSSDAPGAAALALCRFARWGGGAEQRNFARLTGLPRREAEFAVALARGASIAEAAAALGLTIETARNYSKQVYAKLGLRGQADLVRRFHESAASLA